MHSCQQSGALERCRAPVILYESWRAGNHGEQSTSVVCVSVNEIVCMQNEPDDLYLESPGNFLCLESI